MALNDLNQGMKEGAGDRPPYWSFENNGPTVLGTIVDGGKFQGTKYNPNPAAPKVPDTWDNGDPKYTYYLVVATDAMDPSTEGHDGRWTVVLTGNRYTAAQQALKDAGCFDRGFEQGGQFGLRYLGERRNRNGTANYKAFEAFYRPPAVSAGWQQGAQPAPATPTPQQAPPVNPVGPQSYQGYSSTPQPAPQVSAQAWGSGEQGPPPAPAPAQPQETPTGQPPAPMPQPEPTQGQNGWPAPPRQLA